MCCVASDAGGAVVVTSAARAADLPRPPVYVPARARRTAPRWRARCPTHVVGRARAPARLYLPPRLQPGDIDHAMLYDAAANIPLMALDDLGCRGESLVADGHTAIGGSLPVTNGGGQLHAQRDVRHARAAGVRAPLCGELPSRSTAAHLAHAHHRRHVPGRRDASSPWRHDRELT